MENLSYTLLKQIKCKECKNNLKIILSYNNGGYNLCCPCNYINYFYAINYKQLYISSFNYINTVILVIHFHNNQLHFYLNPDSDKCFDALNTGIIFDKSIPFNISDIEKALNIYSGLERNLIFK